jgi:DNA-binding GntR family transcriptional regulator
VPAAEQQVNMTDLPKPDSMAAKSGLAQPKRSSLPEAIADAIAGAIATGHLMPGERVVEMALAEQLGVSRVPVREALKVLQAQGIISGGSHRGGHRVVAFDDKTVRDVLEMRLMLEKILLRDAIRRCRAGEADLSGLREAIGQMRLAAKIESRRASLEADLEFHRAICLAAGNEIGATLWETLARHVLIIFSREDYRDSDLEKVVRQHENFLAYIERSLSLERSEAELEAALRDHLLQVSRAKGRLAG